MLLISPTGCGLRPPDKFGAGYYGAPRGRRKHKGMDFKCSPGQPIRAPIGGRIVRLAYPYADDLVWRGCLLRNPYMDIKMFYFKPTPELIGKLVEQGQEIGIAQDISQKYGMGMTPHIHLQIDSIDPQLILDLRHIM